MLQTITITNEDIVSQVKLCCKIPEFVEAIIARKVVENAAFEASLKVETEELQIAADQIRLMNKLNSADETWAWLEKHSLSIDDYEEIVYSTVISNKLAAHLFANKVEPYFLEHQLDYASVVMYEVFLDDEDLAIELFYAIKEGEISFYDIAHKYIQDRELRRKGGYRGIVYRQDLKPEISAAVFAAKPPQLLKPIVTSSGVHLILVEEIIQPELDNELYQKIASNLFSEWLKKQIAKVDFVKLLDSDFLSSNSEA
ncbi:MAG: peptidylprolyl isomerase [Nostoc sp. EfeVER01]|uniref:peptidylprolyl isomerase n=1 Tax=unclassified Nostoc TaxID=2593658 RepID=UPI002AD3318B|nr:MULTISPECIES: peptidylprolyl isomerase [unclassified Nostoc]MDZ7949299.1 peptidylprolyl isomerase [Nostoc sp. EfeVER01]MDZ7993493.1 peptidylprolyl isomerase [Nostoc sp. EspVER01]